MPLRSKEYNLCITLWQNWHSGSQLDGTEPLRSFSWRRDTANRLMSGRLAAFLVNLSRCKRMSVWIRYIASLSSQANIATLSLLTPSTSSIRVPSHLYRWLPSRPERSTSYDPFHFGQANLPGDVVLIRRERQALFEESRMSSKERFWRDVSTNA